MHIHTHPLLLSPSVLLSVYLMFTGLSYREISSSWMGKFDRWTCAVSVSQATLTSSGSLYQDICGYITMT